MSKIEQAGTEVGIRPGNVGSQFWLHNIFFKTATGCNWLQLSAIGCKKSEEVGSLLKAAWMRGGEVGFLGVGGGS
jgi:hypothetical protein